VVVYQQDDDSDPFAEECSFNSCIRTLAVIDLTPSYDRAQLGVVRCTLVQPEQVIEWRRTVYFKHAKK